MAEKMGFETNRRIVKCYNNQWTCAELCGKDINCRSKLEAHWAAYLNWLWEQGEIVDAAYEPDTFYFSDEKTAPVQYTPDFRVVERLHGTEGCVVYQEVKGYHDGSTNTKLRRMAKHYPEVVMELVLQRIPKRGGKGANRRRVAEKYTRRIIDASDIFKQMKGVRRPGNE